MHPCRRVYICIYVYICVYVCMYLYVCIYLSIHSSIHLPIYASIHRSIYPCSAEHLQRIDKMLASDEAVLHVIPPAWVAGAGITVLTETRRESLALPPGILESSALQRSIYAHILHESDLRPVIGVLCKRLRYYRDAFTADEATVVAAHLRMIFRVFPPHVGLAYLRTVANGWLTTRRLSHAVEHCKFGCQGMGGDCVTHYVGCPHFVDAAAASGCPMPTWTHEGFGADVLLLRFRPQDTILIDAVWRYLLYMIYNQSREATPRWQAHDVALALRTQVWSLSTCSQRVAALLGMGSEGVVM